MALKTMRAFKAVTFACVALITLSSGVWALDKAAVERNFEDWLQNEVWPEARGEGVSRARFEAALNGVRVDWDLPGLNIPTTQKRAQKQQEFSSPGRYFRQSIIEGIARIGKSKARTHARTLETIERKTGVPGRIVLAIWGRESGFGNVGSDHDGFEVLANRGFFGPSKDYFRGELVAALTIADGARLASSWAGALGQPQMMPTSFLAYGADGDGDGTIDIWRSEPDTLASIAKFLADHDWVAGRDWGYEVKLPKGLSCALEGSDNTRPIRDWADLGITRISGRPFPQAEMELEGSLLLPAGTHGPAFIVTPNFYVLKRYNRSDLYALFIGNAADRIAYGMGDFRSRWSVPGGLYRSDVAAIQEALIEKGYDVGGADGLAGFKTRRSIGAWQATTGRTPTCFPDKRVKAALLGG